ncbi:MAG TPA: hypothetical protein VFZ53_22350 [Polyangiaceae bacterium]
MPIPGMTDGFQTMRSGSKHLPTTRHQSQAPMGGTLSAGRTAAPRAGLQPMMEPRSAQVGGAPPQGGGGMASRVSGMMGGRGAPGAGPMSGMAGRVASMFGGGAGGGQPGGGIASRVGGMFGGGAGGGAGRAGMAGMMGGLMSDERSKEKIRELEGIKARYEALIDTPTEKPSGFEGVGSHEFSYKPEFQDEPGAGRGRFAGPMTSELKSIPGVVKEGPGGMEQVDTPRLTMANASATGELSREVDDLRARLAALSDDPDATLDVAGGRRR